MDGWRDGGIEVDWVQQITCPATPRDGNYSARRALSRSGHGNVPIGAQAWGQQAATPPATPKSGSRRRQPATTSGAGLAEELAKMGLVTSTPRKAGRPPGRRPLSRGGLAATAPAGGGRPQPARPQEAALDVTTSLAQTAPARPQCLHTSVQLPRGAPCSVGASDAAAPGCGGAQEPSCCAARSQACGDDDVSCCPGNHTSRQQGNCPGESWGPWSEELASTSRVGIVAWRADPRTFCDSEWSKCDDGGLEVRRAQYHDCVAFCSCKKGAHHERELLAQRVPPLLQTRTKDLFTQLESAGRYPRRCLLKGSGGAAAPSRCQTPLSWGSGGAASPNRCQTPLSWEPVL